jgi:hypothetical protein
MVSFMPQLLYPQKRAPGTHWIGGWEGPRAGLDMALKRKQRNSYMNRERPELWPSNWILHHDNAQANKELSVEQFLAQKLISEMEHPLNYPDLVPNDFWLFPKIKSALKGKKFRILKT